MAFFIVFEKRERDRIIALFGPILRRVGLGRFVPKIDPAKRMTKAERKRMMAEQLVPPNTASVVGAPTHGAGSSNSTSTGT
jgi:hypothetical protein